MGDVAYRGALSSPEDAPGTLPRTGVSLEAAAARFRRRRDRGDTALCNRIAEQVVEALIPMITHHARKFVNSDRPLDILMQAGRVAVIGALERYRPDCGATFLTFAYNTVQGQISNYSRDNGGSDIHEPANLQLYRRKVNRAAFALPEGASVEQIADRAGIPVANVEAVLASEQSVRPTLRFGSYTDMRDTVDPDRHSGFAVDWTPQTDARLLIEQYLPKIPVIYAEIIRSRFFDGETLDEIGARRGCSRENIRIMLRRALAKLRELME